jgi:hypothetical protein
MAHNNPLSAYEQLRQQNIARNKTVMKGLGLEATLIPTKRPTPKRRAAGAGAAAAPPAKPSRRSKRARNEAPDYTRERVDRFGEVLDRLAARAKTGQHGGAGGGGGGGYSCGGPMAGVAEWRPQRERHEIMEDLAAVAAQAREALKALKAKVAPPSSSSSSSSSPSPPPSSSSSSPSSACWRAEAVRRWGPRVLDASPPSWEAYVASRVPVPTAPGAPEPPSPLGLLQESYAADPWRLLVACVLMGRVSSADTKRRCLGAFFGAFPTPSSCLDACTPDACLPLIDSLGLFDSRFKSVVDVTQRFLAQPVVRDSTALSLSPPPPPPYPPLCLFLSW